MQIRVRGQKQTIGHAVLGKNIMKLFEFFNKPIGVHQDQKYKNNTDDKIDDELFWYIIDHDRLHKDYFFPIANKVKKLKECSPEMVLELYMPMVVKGCKEFYHDKQLEGKLSKTFPLKFREDLCHRLHDHYYTDVQKDKYKLG